MIPGSRFQSLSRSEVLQPCYLRSLRRNSFPILWYSPKPRCPENKKQVWDFVVIRWLFRPRSRVANHIKIMKGKSFLDSFLNTFANSPTSRFLRSFEGERFLPNSPRICSLNVITNNIFSNTKLEYTCFRIS
jgi:hypothetical protein